MEISRFFNDRSRKIEKSKILTNRKKKEKKKKKKDRGH